MLADGGALRATLGSPTSTSRPPPKGPAIAACMADRACACVVAASASQMRTPRYSTVPARRRHPSGTPRIHAATAGFNTLCAIAACRLTRAVSPADDPMTATNVHLPQVGQL